jgi:hypothetical protein
MIVGKMIAIKIFMCPVTILLSNFGCDSRQAGSVLYSAYSKWFIE